MIGIACLCLSESTRGEVLHVAIAVVDEFEKPRPDGPRECGALHTNDSCKLTQNASCLKSNVRNRIIGEKDSNRDQLLRDEGLTKNRREAANDTECGKLLNAILLIALLDDLWQHAVDGRVLPRLAREFTDDIDRSLPNGVNRITQPSGDQ